MLSENIKIAYDSLKKNFLRSFLTVTIISIGMTAIMGIITAIESRSHDPRYEDRSQVGMENDVR